MKLNSHGWNALIFRTEDSGQSVCSMSVQYALQHLISDWSSGSCHRKCCCETSCEVQRGRISVWASHVCLHVGSVAFSYFCDGYSQSKAAIHSLLLVYYICNNLYRYSSIRYCLCFYLSISLDFLIRTMISASERQRLNEMFFSVQRDSISWCKRVRVFQKNIMIMWRSMMDSLALKHNACFDCIVLSFAGDSWWMSLNCVLFS